MDLDPDFYRLRDARVAHEALLKEIAEGVARNEAIRAEIQAQHAEQFAVLEQLRTANAALLAKSLELMESARRLGTLAKADAFLAEQSQKESRS